MSGSAPTIELIPVTAEAAEAILAGEPPPGVAVAEDYPTEFSSGVAESAGREGMLGPFFISRRDDGLVVGELGGSFHDESTVEIGYAVVDSQSGRGFATAAVIEFIEVARGRAGRIVAHTPPDRPESGRVLAKAGFTSVGEVKDEHEGVVLTVQRWELEL